MFEHINQKKERLDAHRPLPKYTVKSLREKLLLEWTYNTNAIEGNTLTINETKVVLEGITVGGKMLREHLEVVNHRDAIHFVEEIVQKDEPLSEWQMKSLHHLVLKGIDDEYAGVYRDQQVFISSAEHIPPAPFFIKEEMEQLMAWYEQAETKKMHPVARGAMLHAIFVGIHPFIDGNGRISRLLLNLELMKDGYPPIVIKVENRIAYYEALDKAHTQEYDDFIKLVAGEVEDSLNLYVSAINKNTS
ncbi:Fic family protein [Salibacterium salarium]|uniref:Fic family protein n=1 Tax=Salibacterium salarium TaxID=284579 RepID=A0A428MV26_9BACI|nr:Fic family protein [Salibacterium salarium]RSL29972.1 Fic family protein [Salibacterium salarium]